MGMYDWEVGDQERLDAQARKERYVAEMKRLIAPKGDIEALHSLADELLCDLLAELGYQEVVAAWLEVPKWYA